MSGGITSCPHPLWPRTDHHGLRMPKDPEDLIRASVALAWLSLPSSQLEPQDYKPGTQDDRAGLSARTPKTELDIEHLLRKQGRDEDEPLLENQSKD